MKYLIMILAFLMTISISAQWSFNTTSGSGIESSSNTASGFSSIAMGEYTTASGGISTAMGNTTGASGFCSIAMGEITMADGNWSTAMGFGTSAVSNFSTAMGKYTSAFGENSTSMGHVTTASDFATLAIGQYNTNDTTPNPITFSLANRAFIIGNGADSTTMSDAMTVLFDGTTTIAGDLNINSDARLKSNIISLGGTLAKLLALDGKSYTFKADESKQKIGLLAQDVQEVFPELVTEAQDEQGTLSVNYQGLIPVLINAIKEQQKEIEELKTEVNKLRNQ